MVARTPPVVDMPELLKLDEVAVRLRRSTRNVRVMVRNGTFPVEDAVVKVGARSMMRRADLDAFLAGSSGPPAA